ncbi:serine/threonine-protein kinase [Streptacidiphilus cavernicola]|uniref:non-specific serine/threonine protein kinase n=1 Tax=Streptacidiphilus cavernicola TaxID=3342716 RepID=A0ABV6VTN2_9ACTN
MGTEEGSTVGPGRGDEAVRGPATQPGDAPRMLAGRYLLGDRLGRGGMGTVWRARDRMLDRDVAVKELSVNHLAEEDLLIVQSRMRQEARAAARIKHPGVVTIHDVLEQDGKPWIVMELIDGRSLAELVEQEGTLNPREAAGIGAQVLAALHRGHQVGVIHRDVKPANVLLERATGRVVLTDFGIATYEGDSALTRTGDLIGSPDYLAPERVHGHRPGPESDLWGLGATLYAAVEGQSPFRRDSPLTTLAAVVTDPLPEPQRAGALAPVLHALMTKDAAGRPGAPEAIRMLQDVASGITTAISLPPASDPLRTPTQRVPVADRNEPPSPSLRDTERLRPSYVESEFQRPTPQQGTSAGTPVGTPAGGVTGRQTAVAGPGTRPAPAQRGGGTAATAVDRPGGRRRRRTWPWLVVAGLVAALAGGGAAYELSTGHSGGTDRGGQGGTPTSPPASPTPSASVPAAAFTPKLAPGYTYRHDPGGFTFALPPAAAGHPWVRSDPSGGTLAITYSPDGGLHKVIFGVTPNQIDSPIGHARDMQKNVTVDDSSYQLVGMKTGTFHGSLEAAQWEYTFVSKTDQQPHHAVEELFKAGDGTEYDILVDYPEADWSTGYQRFLDILNGFSGDG